jgi:hypothetical protein
MSERLQILLDEAELREIRRVAKRQRLTVSEWARQALRRARMSEAAEGPDRKLAAVRAAVKHRFPAGSIEQMLGEIEQGYAGGGSE